MKPKPSKLIRTISNIAAAFMPTRRLRSSVRNFIRQTNARKRLAYTQIKHEWENRGLHPIPARYDEYDLVFAIGTTCKISDIAIRFSMRTFSNPFEWITGANPTDFYEQPDIWRDSRFIEKIDALCSDFINYFNFEDFRQISSQNSTSPHHTMVNIRTNITFWHLFPSDQSWESYFPTARETIMKRGNRLIDTINESERILILWGHRLRNQKSALDAPVSDADIRRAVKLLNKKWPTKKFDLAFFEHDGTKGRFEFDKINVCEGAYRIISNHYCDSPEYHICYATHTNAYSAPLVMAEMLDNIKLAK